MGIPGHLFLTGTATALIAAGIGLSPAAAAPDVVAPGPASAVRPAENQAAASTPRYVKSGGSALYKSRSTSGTKLRGRMVHGTRLTLKAVEGRWAQVSEGRYTGWVPRSKVQKKRPLYVYKKRFNRFTVKDAPSRTRADYGSKVRALQAGTHVLVEAKQGDWMKVSDGERKGWVVGPSDLTTSSHISARKHYEYTRKDVPLRRSRDYSSTLITMPGGTRVLVTGQARDWLRVKWDGRTGYVMGPGGGTNTQKDIPLVNVKDVGRFNVRTTSLRASPTTRPYASKVATIKPNEKVTATHRVPGKGRWFRVTYRGKSGYMPSIGRLTVAGKYSFGVYGTLRTGQSAYSKMAGYRQKLMNRHTAASSLYQWGSPDLTFLTHGPKSVVTEQFQYSDAKGASLKRALDKYEVVRYQGKNMYRRAYAAMTDGSSSWVYRASSIGERVVKNSGRYISSGDFLKRS